uniref:Uncharacterized protein n=1 Tax=viral metagenome TaxID=1070528 RepID=A0A6C0HVV8_9ZZZZ
MVSFKETKGKVVFGLTIVLIILSMLLVFLLFLTKNKDYRKESIKIFMIWSFFITFFLSLTLSILNNKYRNDKELSDSDTMDKALSGIPIIILILTWLIGGISMNRSKLTSTKT